MRPCAVDFEAIHCACPHAPLTDSTSPKAPRRPTPAHARGGGSHSRQRRAPFSCERRLAASSRRTRLAAPPGRSVATRQRPHSALALSGATRNQCSATASAISVASIVKPAPQTASRDSRRQRARRHDGRDRHREREEACSSAAASCSSRDSADAAGSNSSPRLGTPKNTLSLALSCIHHSDDIGPEAELVGLSLGDREQNDGADRRRASHDRGWCARPRRSGASPRSSGWQGVRRGPVTKPV